MEEPIFRGNRGLHPYKGQYQKLQPAQECAVVYQKSSGPHTGKNRLYKLALRSKKPDDWIKYCAVRNKTSNAVRAAKYRFINKKASRLANPACTVTTWWRTARDICGFKPPTHADIPPLLDKATGIHLSEDVDKANLLNDTYVNENTSLNPTAFSYGPTQTQTVFSIKSFSEVEVSGVIQSLPNKLSTGADKISYRLLKEAGPGLISPLTALFNRSVDAGEVPDEWKAAEITPVFKGGNKDRRMPSNYRPIALTCCIARVLEKLINKRLLSYLIQHKILYQHQSGFLPKHSTTSQLCFLLHKWHAALERGNSAHIAFLDLSKAYDRVSIAGLIYKLSQIGLSVPTLKWFSSFLTAREQCVKINGQKSQWLKLKSGIPQGTVLGPTLFLLFINDLPVNLSEDCSIFADDTTAYSIGGSSEETAQALSSDLQKAHDWATTWGMLFNAEKSKHLMVANKSRLTPAPRVNMNGVTLPTCTTHKHLGITLNSSLTWQDHINSIYSTCARQVGILARLRNVLTKTTVKKIYIGFIRPRLEYASAVWSGGNIAKLSKLQDAFAKRHKIILPSLKTRFDYHTLMLFFKIRQSATPSYLTTILPKMFNESTSYRLRKLNYPFPAVRRTSSLQEFFPRAIALWNNLPREIQQANSVGAFKRNLRLHLHL